MNKTVILGVTGSIAAYKSCDIVRRLREKGIQVNCILTKSAMEFVSPLTFQTLSGETAYSDLFELEPIQPEHISLAQKADLVLIAPATANIISKISCGIADDLLTTTVLSTKAPVLIAPAMNEDMYTNAILQENIFHLKSKGVSFIEPEKGALACSREGIGRLAKVERIVTEVEKILKFGVARRGYLKGRTVLITAGPTREYIDAVRFISNSSSGRMGYALAEEAKSRGAEVILVSGPVQISPPEGVRTTLVRTADEMKEKVEKNFKQADIVICSAAVGDWKPEKTRKEKIKGDLREVKLLPNPDILAGLGKKKENKVLVGFALEGKNLVKEAKRKLREKNLDLIVANSLESMEEEDAQVVLVFPSGRTKTIKDSKKNIAVHILNEVSSLK